MSARWGEPQRVTGIKLEGTDEVIGMEVFPAKEVVPADKKGKSFSVIF